MEILLGLGLVLGLLSLFIWLVHAWLVGHWFARAMMGTILAVVGGILGLVGSAAAYSFDNVPGQAAICGAVLGLIAGIIVTNVPVWLARARAAALIQRKNELLYPDLYPSRKRVV